MCTMSYLWAWMFFQSARSLFISVDMSFSSLSSNLVSFSRLFGRDSVELFILASGRDVFRFATFAAVKKNF